MENKSPGSEQFYPYVLGIIFDPQNKKILIAKTKNSDHLPGITWGFPGDRVRIGEELEEALKRTVKEETGLEVESLGVIFAKTYPEKRDTISVYYLTEVVGGEEKAGENISELKWVSPKELQLHFTSSFHPKLREYLEGLVE